MGENVPGYDIEVRVPAGGRWTGSRDNAGSRAGAAVDPKHLGTGEPDERETVIGRGRDRFAGRPRV